MNLWKFFLPLGVICALALGVLVVPALATPPSGVTPTFFGRGTLGPFHMQTNDFKIHSKNPTDVVMRKAEIAVGGHAGWHTHPGPTFVIVTQGLFELTRAEDCTPHVLGPGEAFVEQGNDVHIARNAGGPGDPPVVVYIAQLDVPVGGAFSDQTVAAPANCDVPFD